MADGRVSTSCLTICRCGDRFPVNTALPDTYTAVVGQILTVLRLVMFVVDVTLLVVTNHLWQIPTYTGGVKTHTTRTLPINSEKKISGPSKLFTSPLFVDGRWAFHTCNQTHWANRSFIIIHRATCCYSSTALTLLIYRRFTDYLPGALVSDETGLYRIPVPTFFAPLPAACRLDRDGGKPREHQRVLSSPPCKPLPA